MTETGEPLALEVAPRGTTARRFTHDAMATTYGIVVLDEAAEYAASAAREAFAEIDRLEAELSRFVPISDVSRINALAAGGTTRVGLATFECLELADGVWRETGGAFDVTIGPLLAWWRQQPSAGGGPDEAARMADPSYARARALASFEHVVLDRPSLSVGVCAAGMGVDLGGIGKGYAVDRALAVLREWGIGSALVHSGQSTARALAGSTAGGRGEAWAVGLRGPAGAAIARVELGEMALAGSGRALHGEHIIDPRTGTPAGHAERVGTWSLAPSAALADALSTAFMVMEREAIEAYCAGHPEVGACWLEEREGGYARVVIGAFGGRMEGG